MRILTPTKIGRVVISFFEGDEWMCHPGDTEFMPVDKTWGIMPPSGMPPSADTCLCFNFSLMHNGPSFYAA